MWKDVGLKSGSPARYGLGWTLADRNGHREVYHGGSINGFESYFIRFPEDGLSFVILTNLAAARPAVILHRIVEATISGVKYPEPRPGS